MVGALNRHKVSANRPAPEALEPGSVVVWTLIVRRYRPTRL